MLIACLGVAGTCGCGAAALRPASAPPDRTLSIGGANLSLAYPAHWYATARRVTDVTSPAERAVVATFRVPAGARPHLHARLPADGAFLMLYEDNERYARLQPPRPAHFRFVGRQENGALACFGFPWPARTIRFREKGRSFNMSVALGPRASVATRVRVLRVLDSIRVGRSPHDVEYTP